MKKWMMIMVTGVLFAAGCADDQGDDRFDSADGKNGESYTDKQTTDSTRMMSDSTVTVDTLQ